MPPSTPATGRPPSGGDEHRRRRRKAARHAAIRRRRRVTTGAATVIAILVATVLVVDTSHGHELSDRQAAERARSATLPVGNPLTTPDAKARVHSRSGTVSAAVDDLRTGQEWILNPGARDQTASIIKADILETVLHQTIAAHKPLADAETETAEDMIEASDNDDATALWDQIGGASGIGAFNARAGLTQTTPNDDGYWGETLTSAADQIKVLRQLAVSSRLLTPAAQRYELSLMENVDAGEGWGVSGGVPSGVTVALKNGWVPLTSNTDWEINSIGWVDGDGRDYLIAVLTAHDPSKTYGVHTIDWLSTLIYRELAPRTRSTAT